MLLLCDLWGKVGKMLSVRFLGGFNTSLIPKLKTQCGNNHIVHILEVKYCNKVKIKFNLASNPLYGYRNSKVDGQRKTTTLSSYRSSAIIAIGATKCAQ